MTYKDIFKETTELLVPINARLEDKAFMESSIEFLCGEGVRFNIDDDEISVSYDGPGIYMFWASLSFAKSRQELSGLLSEFLDEWDKDTDSISFFPKSNRNRTKKFLKDADPEEMVPFYLGKSEKISTRINQHLFLEPNKKTYALKLKHRANILKGIQFEITWLPLECDKESYFLVAKVESLIREKLNPIIGKQ